MYWHTYVRWYTYTAQLEAEMCKAKVIERVQYSNGTCLAVALRRRQEYIYQTVLYTNGDK